MLGLFSDLGSAAFGLICSHEQHVTVQTEEPPPALRSDLQLTAVSHGFPGFWKRCMYSVINLCFSEKMCNYVVLWTIIITKAVNRKLEKLKAET